MSPQHVLMIMATVHFASLGVPTVGMHVIPWHLRWRQALPEGVRVVVLLLQRDQPHLLVLRVGERGAEALHVRAQTATGGCCGTGQTAQELRSTSLCPERPLGRRQIHEDVSAEVCATCLL